MKNISKMTIVTLGVADLGTSTAFYAAVLGTPPTVSEGITFVQLPGTWLALYPLAKLAEDISPEIPVERRGFPGVTLAHNARSKDDVVAILNRAAAAGARIMKAPQPAFWGGVHGYFSDLDGYYWEVAWGPMFAFAENGDMTLSESE